MAEKDPALEPVKHQISGALYAPEDESGDAHLFTRELARVCKENGVRFLWNRSVEGFAVTRNKVTSIATDKGPLKGDIFINAFGVYAPNLARQLEDDIPVYPVKGYSATVPTAGRNNTPRLGGVDEENLLAYCPMGDRLRITATAEFSGYDRTHTKGDFEHMFKTARALFPDGADFDKASYWAGLRPMTPEGTPIFGTGRCDNLWYVSGLGHMGWTMCHGAGRITADLIAGKTPAIPLDGMVLGD